MQLVTKYSWSDVSGEHLPHVQCHQYHQSCLLYTTVSLVMCMVCMYHHMCGGSNVAAEWMEWCNDVMCTSWSTWARHCNDSGSPWCHNRAMYTSTHITPHPRMSTAFNNINTDNNCDKTMLSMRQLIDCSFDWSIVCVAWKAIGCQYFIPSSWL